MNKQILGILAFCALSDLLILVNHPLTLWC